MLKNDLHTLTGQDTSMNYWARMIKKNVNEDSLFAHALLKEESSKTERLIILANTIGLPIYETFQFILPNDLKDFMNLCEKKIKDGWKLSLRYMDINEEQLLFRHLDIDVNGAVAAIEKLNNTQIVKANISPYKIPSISGTLIIRESDVLLEMVFGPHYWITKLPPKGITIHRCWYYFPKSSIKYSSIDPQIRFTLFRILKDVVEIVFGLRVQQLSEVEKSVYAEFGWQESLGYKFFDCSFSQVWTGIINI